MRWPGIFASMVMVVAVSALLGCGGEAPRGKVLVLALDGLDPRAVDLLMSEDKMPNFARLRRDGAYGPLTSQMPLLSPIIWTTIATGKGPEAHGIGHFVAVNPETGAQLPVTSRMRRVKALWNIVSEAERQVAVVGWWATWPPEAVNGVMISDHIAYHFLFEEGTTGGEATEAKTHPPELLAEIEPLLRRPTDLRYEELAPYVQVSREDFAAPFNIEDELAHFKWALVTAESYRDIGLSLWRQRQPDLAMVYVEGTDSTSHLFGHLFRASGLAGELAAQQAQYGGAVEAIYGLADRIVGDYLEAMDDDTTLVVLSDHGFDLGTLHEDPSMTRDMRRVSERFHNIEGILYLYGRGVARGARLDRPQILDVAPTVLSLLGVPPAEDMPGRVLDEGLSRIAVPARIATYETGTAPPTGLADDLAETDEAVDEARLAHLRSLGYLGGGAEAESSPEGDRNLAAIHFEAGRYREAAKMYQQLVEAAPDDASLRTSLAGCLGALGRYEAAREELEKAIELDPLNVEAYHNLAVVHERRGDRDQAVEDYRRALRYNPRYEPSRQALRRLVGSAEIWAPRDEAEARAARLAEEASLAARQGRYSEALALLDQAAAAAPRYALVYQYRANVAYLMGDREKAIAALEKGLALEPDNALFQENIKRLEAAPLP